MKRPPGCLRLFLGGDVMLGRGIDQIQLRSCDPRIFESHVSSAQDYVTLAERASDAIPRGVGPRHVWGDLLADLDTRDVDLRLVNLETSITSGGTHDPLKGIHYRMHPANVAQLRAAGIDAATLANNHVLDWGRYGLDETLDTLAAAGIARAGAGRDAAEAFSPLSLGLPGGGRFLVFALALGDSGVPASWAARPDRPGVARPEPEDVPGWLSTRLATLRRVGDIVALSIHWGDNWGYAIPPTHRAIAAAAVGAGVDLVFGHSSHHLRAVEVIDGHLVMYGAGDLINDYEGIGGHREFCPDLVLGYVADIRRDNGRLVALEMLPYRLRRFRLERTDRETVDWLARRMDREAGRFGGRVAQTPEATLRLEWAEDSAHDPA